VRGKADNSRGKAGVGEGTVALSASVRSGVRCRVAQPAWEGGRQVLNVKWWGGVERWADQSAYQRNPGRDGRT
jgi:hypothetical protein